MGSHPYQPDHAAELADELIAYLRTKPRIAALGEALGSQLQELEESLLDLRDERTLDVAVGEQLDQYGRLVGEQRGALADDEFRRFIAARILSNTSQGVPDRLIDVIRILAGPFALETPTTYTEPIYIPRYPAGYTLTVIREPPALTAAMKERIRAQMVSITPAGVEPVLIEAMFTADGPFRFDCSAVAWGAGFDVGELAGLIE